MSWTRSAISRKSGSDKPHISEKARQRPVRVLPPDDRAEMEAGHLIPRPDPMQETGGYGHESRTEFAPDAGDNQPNEAGETDNEPGGFAGGGFSSSFEDREV